MFLLDIAKELLNEFSKFTSLFEVFVCLHAIIRFTFKKNTQISEKNRLLNLTLLLLCFTLTIAFFVILLFLMIPFILFKLTIILILRIKYRKNYGGLLESADALWVAEDDRARNIINVLFLVQFSERKENLTEYVREICRQKFLKSDRLTSVRKEYMGYICFIKNQLSADDIVKDMRLPNIGVCTKKALQKYIQDSSNKPLPRNNTATWELLVGQQPFEVQGYKSEGYQYPILVRVHHSVGDGVTLLSLLIQHISDEGVSVLKTFHGLTHNEPILKKVKLGLSKLWNNIRAIARVYAYLVTIVTPIDSNILHGPVLSGEKKLGFYIEGKPEYIQKVKRIKNRLANSTFSSVLYTAISASLNNYFQKHTERAPNHITLTFMQQADKKQLKYTHDKLRNIFSMGSIKLPINLNVDSKKASLIDRFTKIKEECELFDKSYDIWIYHWQLQIFANLIPAKILKSFIKLNTVTTASFSNLPGFKRIHISENALNHILFWVPNYVTVGIGFSVITYDDRFQMGLLVDKVLIPEEEDVQNILNDVFKYIDLLNEEFDQKAN